MLRKRVARVCGVSNLGVGEAGGRHGEVVEDVGPPAHVLHSTDALRARCVRQHVLACARHSTQSLSAPH